MEDVPGCNDNTTHPAEVLAAASEVASIKSFLPTFVRLRPDAFHPDVDFPLRPNAMAREAEALSAHRSGGRPVRAYWRPAGGDHVVAFVGRVVLRDADDSFAYGRGFLRICRSSVGRSQRRATSAPTGKTYGDAAQEDP